MVGGFVVGRKVGVPGNRRSRDTHAGGEADAYHPRDGTRGTTRAISPPTVISTAQPLTEPGIDFVDASEHLVFAGRGQHYHGAQR